MLPDEELRRRLRAARALVGVTVEELAERLATEGLSAKTIGNVERGTRTIRPMELREIAAALGVSYEFFTVPLDRLAGPASDGVGEIIARLDRIEDALLIQREETALSGSAMMRRLRDDPAALPARPEPGSGRARDERRGSVG